MTWYEPEDLLNIYETGRKSLRTKKHNNVSLGFNASCKQRFLLVYFVKIRRCFQFLNVKEICFPKQVL